MIKLEKLCCQITPPLEDPQSINRILVLEFFDYSGALVSTATCRHDALHKTIDLVHNQYCEKLNREFVVEIFKAEQKKVFSFCVYDNLDTRLPPHRKITRRLISCCLLAYYNTYKMRPTDIYVDSYGIAEFISEEIWDSPHREKGPNFETKTFMGMKLNRVQDIKKTLPESTKEEIYSLPPNCTHPIIFCNDIGNVVVGAY